MSLLIATAGLSAERPAQEPVVVRALSEAARQGFREPVRLSWQSGAAWWYATPGNPRGSGACRRHGDRFAAYVGTAHWNGLTREALLDRLLADHADFGTMPLDDFAGSFVMLVGGPSGVWLFNDPLGLHKLYETRDGKLASTSFMVCRATLRAPQVDRLRAQEYVLLGANHALETPLQDVRIADPLQARELRSGERRTLFPPDRWRMPCPVKRPEEAVEALSERIRVTFEEMVRAFGADIGMALSGGFDSRLLLAALDRVGVAPTLYVYGRSEDDDVLIATRMAQRLGMPIECIDKAALNAGRPALTSLTLKERIAFFDGLPPDGAFDLGADRDTRLKQVAGGRLNLNGGGGEILRNFFYLRDERFSAGDLAAAFYSNWPAEVFASDDERRAFVDAMTQGIARCLGRDGRLDEGMPRSDVELVYSLFRLRYWMGRNNSLAGRYGAFLTPLVHPRLVPLAASLPLRWKNFGRLEAAVLASLSPRVAAGPSAYGFEFINGPSTTYRLKVSATLYRPVAVRRLSGQARRWLRLATPTSLPWAWRDAAAELVPQDWLNADALTGEDSLNRLLTLQAVCSDAACGVNELEADPAVLEAASAR